MAINNGTQQYQNNGNNFINLAAINGSGETTMFVDDVEGILIGIEMRDGFYTVQDRRTGQMVQRPNSWIGHWLTSKGEKRMSWPTYQDEQGRTCPWDKFDDSINLAQCSAQQIHLHMWKDDRNFYHLEFAQQQQQVQQNLNPMPIMGQQAPWTPQN